MNERDMGQILLKLNMNKGEIHNKEDRVGRILKYNLKRQDDSYREKSLKREMGT